MSEKKSKGLKKFFTAEFYLFLFLIAALLFMAIAAPDFYNLNNLMSLVNKFNYTLIAAIGMNLIIITSNIDVSAGALISVLCAAAACLGKAGLEIWAFLPIIMLFGGLLSFFNGILITKMRIPSIVATLATTQLFQGILPLVYKASTYDLGENFTWLAYKAKIFGIFPGSTLLMLVVTVIFLLFMKYSKFSKQLYAIGNNQNGARLAGVNVDKVIVTAYVIAGFLYGITAIIIATASQRVTSTMANGKEMTFIAAVVVGGTSTAGGKGKLIGTVIGAFILSMVAPALNYIGINPDWSDAIMGALIIIAVVASEVKTVRKRRVKTA